MKHYFSHFIESNCFKKLSNFSFFSFDGFSCTAVVNNSVSLNNTKNKVLLFFQTREVLNKIELMRIFVGDMLESSLKLSETYLSPSSCWTHRLFSSLWDTKYRTRNNRNWEALIRTSLFIWWMIDDWLIENKKCHFHQLESLLMGVSFSLNDNHTKRQKDRQRENLKNDELLCFWEEQQYDEFRLVFEIQIEFLLNLLTYWGVCPWLPFELKKIRFQCSVTLSQVLDIQLQPVFSKDDVSKDNLCVSINNHKVMCYLNYLTFLGKYVHYLLLVMKELKNFIFLQAALPWRRSIAESNSVFEIA